MSQVRIVLEGPTATPQGDGTVKIEFFTPDWATAGEVIEAILRRRLGAEDSVVTRTDLSLLPLGSHPSRLLKIPVLPFLLDLAQASGPKGTGRLTLCQILDKITDLGWRHNSKTPTITIRVALGRLCGNADWVKRSGARGSYRWEFRPPQDEGCPSEVVT